MPILIDRIVLLLALIMPCMPKFYIMDGIQMYPFEILMLIVFWWYVKYMKINIQKTLLLLWLFVFVSTIISYLNYVAVGGIMRCVKEIVYIPLLYIAFKSTKLQLKHLCYIFILASIGNLWYTFSVGLSLESIDIWNTDVLSSGFSNKVFDIGTFSIKKMENVGAHAIWGDYCVLIACVSFLLYETKQISIKKLYVILFFVIVNIAISVSRESLLLFICVVVAYFYSKYGLTKWFLISILLILIVISYVVCYYGESMAIVQKMKYMSDSIAETGTENNIQLRINGWYVYFMSLTYHPWAWITGYGFNNESYESFLDFPEVLKMSKTSFVTIPESFFVETLYYGGIGAFVYGVRFWKHLYKFFLNIPERKISIILLGFFVGLLFGNIFSGATVICDLLYSQFLIVLGLILRDYKLLSYKKTENSNLSLGQINKI